MGEKLDENFFYNTMLTKALIQLLPPFERRATLMWFEKLLTMDKSKEEKEMRNEYLWFILLMLQCQKIREPFNRPPPDEMEPLRDIVPAKVYEEILIANDENMEWLERPDSQRKSVQFNQTAPPQFFQNQPTPKEGIICYIAAFSDRSI
ncbi:unnamed protein product [Acanthoscelides obtectus]|uniref:DUF4485 domain-containing protein n=1 Tax=Acanthoscelides obtectus TaxID=200917 RepID=A0A9P0PQD0_ACAOB|nr:unnamed protein product [Acanthoscelides obtectus]CAK1640653.1 hypothetical protein AOBTE_LOCUS11845 [Acanthoscelides obtectus]